MNGMKLAGNLSEIIRLIENEPSGILAKSVSWRNSGDLDSAEISLKVAISLHPENWQCYYELAVLYSIKKNYESAAFMFKEALIRNPNSVASYVGAVANYAISKKFHEIHDLYEIVNSSSIEIVEKTKTLSDYASFCKDFPLSQAESIWNKSVETRGGLVDCNYVENQILTAIKLERPFAFVRLGDGEGTWLQHDLSEEANYGNLFSSNRDTFWNIWYGTEKENQKEFFGVTKNIALNLKDADIIGVPPFSWIEHEYKTASLRGVPGTLNALRVAEKHANQNAKFCTQLMHIELDRKGKLPGIIKSSKKIGLFTCHPDLTQFIEDNFNVNVFKTYLIPGEPSRRHLHGSNVQIGKHFPDRYFEIMKDISSSNFHGVLFLVAGGILGKDYVLALKKSGAIAIDIGSIADKLLGKKTRPGY